MSHKGSDVYNQPDFFSNYLNRRGRPDSPNNAIEGPVMFELVGNFKNKSILDLGCGDGLFGKELLRDGAAKYTGVEGSSKMADAATINLKDTNGEVILNTMESYSYPENSFDLVTSRFAIHYVSNINELFRSIHKSLKNNGKLVFSVQHPLTTSSFLSKQTGERRENWIVDNYFIDGEREEPWIDHVVVKFHRTIEQYFTALREEGFTILELREGTPKREHFSSEEEFKRRQRIPVVLAFSCVKNS
ncbi:class I SAM-dependent methyltransferase [Psychrobacillus sp. NPDC093200]|uniref:class I SAM-dependent methyltransferase n=1 Tax=Psychrobacillus sp. NPDC093200 TaxID=3390656 RepID=UPI003D002661